MLTILLGVFGAPAATAQLDLSLEATVDVSGLGIEAAGGAAVDPDSGSLWLCDGCGPSCPNPGSHRVWEVDPLSGAPISSFDAGVVPGLDVGPDAMALRPGVDELFLFSPYLESEAGVTTKAGVFLREFGSARSASAAAFSPDGELWVYSDPGGGAGGDGMLDQLDPQTGAVLSSRSIVGYSGRVLSMDFDPLSGNLFCFADLGDDLLEIDLATGQVLSTTDLFSFGIDGLGIPTGFAFSGSGDRLFLFKGTADEAEEYLVLRRRTPWKDLGFGLAGSNGVPELSGEGTLLPGSTVSLRLRDARSRGRVFLVIGFSRIDAPFAGGTMVPALDDVLRLRADSNGSLDLQTIWPDGIPSGTDLFFQAWILDFAGPQGFAASNALCVTTS